MGYSIYIKDPDTGETIELAEPHHIAGSTYCIGGTTELYLSITYNYSPFYYRAETLGESTKVYGEKPVDGALPVLHEEYGGIYGLQALTIPQARERVLRAINALRDEALDEHGRPYVLTASDKEQGHTIDNYWVPTERNARKALVNLLNLLILAPEHGKIEVY